MKLYFAPIDGISAVNLLEEFKQEAGTRDSVIIYGIELNCKLFGLSLKKPEQCAEFTLASHEYLVGFHGLFSRSMKSILNMGIITRKFKHMPDKQRDPFFCYQ